MAQQPPTPPPNVSSTQVESARYAFGACVLNLARRELRVANRLVALQPRSFDLLAFLVSHPSRAWTKEELIAAVWPTTAVTDAVLTTAVAKIRRAIDDVDDTAPMLHTVHGLGYRFDAPVRALLPATLTNTAASPPALARNVAAAGESAQPQATVADAAGSLQIGPTDQTPPRGADDGPAARVAATLFQVPELAEEAFWQRQARQAASLEALGQAEAALDLLVPAVAHLPPDDELIRLHARLLRRRARLAEAGELLARALAEPRPDRPPRMRAALLVELAWVRDLQQDLHGARSAIDDAVLLLTPEAADAPLLAEALAGQAALLYRAGRYAQGLRLTQRVIELTDRTPNPAARATALEVRGRCAAREDDIEGAFKSVLDALRLSWQAGLPQSEAEASIRLAYLCELGWRFDLQAEHGRRAAEIVTARGDLITHDRGRAHQLWGLIHLGRLDEAGALLARCAPDGTGRSGSAVYNYGMAQAELHWREGRLRQGLAALEAVLDLPHAVGVSSDSQVTCALRALALGEAARARQLAVQPTERLGPERQATLEAALALHDGDRDRAKRTLRMLWASQRASTGWVKGAVVSLAWMLIEDGDDDSLPTLMQLVDTLPATQAAVPLLQHLHALHRQAMPFDTMVWGRLVRANHGLVHRHAWLLAPDAVPRLLARQGPRLAELYSEACF